MCFSWSSWFTLGDDAIGRTITDTALGVIGVGAADSSKDAVKPEDQSLSLGKSHNVLMHR